MINGALEVVRRPVELYKHLVEVPAPLFATAHAIHPLAPEFRREHGTKPIPPVAHRFVADLDATLMKQVFDVAQRQRKLNVEHHSKPYDLWAGFDLTESGAFGHAKRLAKRHDRLKQSSSDTTGAGYVARLMLLYRREIVQGSAPFPFRHYGKATLSECRKEARPGGAITESSKKDRAQIGGALTY